MQMQFQPGFYDFAIELAKKDTVIQQQQVRIEELQNEIRNLRKKLEQVRAENLAGDRPSQQQTRYWTSDEHKRFLEALAKYGAKDVKSIAAYVGSRNPTQVRTHAQKYFLKLGKQEGKMDDDSGMMQMGYGSENGGHKLVRSESLDNPSADPALQNGYLQAGETRRGLPMGRKRGPELHVDINDPMGMKRSPESPSSESDDEDDMKRRRAPDGFGNGFADAPRYVAQQISCVGESVICALKGLTPMEYVMFLKGLLENAEEHDIAKKCRNIQQTYLQRFTVDDVQHCYLLLVNITKAKSQASEYPPLNAPPVGSPTDFPRGQDFGQGFQHAQMRFSQQPGGTTLQQPSIQQPAMTPVAPMQAQPPQPSTTPQQQQQQQPGIAPASPAPQQSRPTAPSDPFTNIDVIQAQQEAERQAMAGLSDLASLCQQ